MVTEVRCLVGGTSKISLHIRSHFVTILMLSVWYFCTKASVA